MVERFTMTSHPVEGGAMDVHPHGDYVLYSDFAELAAENERLTKEQDRLSAYFRDEAAMDGFEGDVQGWTPIETAIVVMRRYRSEALSRTGAAMVELSGNSGDLIDRMASAIRGDTTSDDTPWATLSEDRKIGWRGDAERALAVVKECLTVHRSSEQAVKDEMVEAALVEWFKSEVPWSGGMAPATKDQMFGDMRSALKAAMEAGG